ncbi:N-acetylmannosamine-6-phosphate 2-epimerase [Candidatus Sodalis pierantonius str. SOPE]|uniref:Putative N-acetylmannosamine-6-phosphate 2-epimerase n=1 Tax=Candidatus Sodalis pierantonii str. SOPE TaxID=2342 RepID=W0HP80_9GAMM|nr:N-acetylmannosamine-6-phosphate 2-epimerase [Candidatus Sodalis pierantonius]AHF73918.1 N-acetylmannosamine-6-phosphate 2-epimerase [Candidatus Sodalis pierantonius str. SOPE]
MTESMLTTVKGKLVVSCQALEQEPLHGAQIMARMALAAQQGGAAAIRANGLADVAAVRRQVALPVIAIIKRDYPDSEVFITATVREIDELMAAQPPMIAIDATDRPCPGGGSLAQQVAYCRRHYPQLLLMADIASVAQARAAEHLGFDVIGTTLYGYTDASRGRTLAEHDFVFLHEVVAAVSRPVIAEGNVLTPAMAARCLQLGCHAVVVAGAITRPQQITARFVSAMETGNDASAGNED